MTFEQLQEANKTLTTMDIKGKGYVLVNERVKAFRMLYPNGIITTEIVSLADGVVVMKATVSDENGCLLSTGYAYEKESSTYINKTSYIENCETSAVGRALGFLGIGIDTSIASYDEVQNAVNNQGGAVEQPKPKEQPKPANQQKPIGVDAAAKLLKVLDKNGIAPETIFTLYQVKSLSNLTSVQEAHIELNLEKIKQKQAEDKNK